jgi:HSP20 family protein
MKNMETNGRLYMTSPCDIVEEEGKILLRLDMPGVTRDNLTIRVENDELLIEGRRRNPDARDVHYLIRETSDRDFRQVFTLDSTIDRNAIDAKLENGQLILTLSLKESEKPRKIEIKTSAP